MCGRCPCKNLDFKGMGMKKALFGFTVLGLCVSVFAQNASDFEYYADNGSITITRYIGTVKDVVIPEEIDNLPVVVIGRGAFSNNQLTGVVIPNSVREIRGSAFSFNQLRSVALPGSLTGIENEAFRRNSLTGVVIPDSVIEIGGYAFQDNPLTSIVIGNSVKKIGNEAFRNNLSGENGQLTSVVIPEKVQIYVSSFDNFFGNFYSLWGTGSMAGTYEYRNKQWDWQSNRGLAENQPGS
jgi:hypothetical protein